MGLKTENPSHKWSLGFVEGTFCPSANEIPSSSDSNQLIGSVDFFQSAGGPLFPESPGLSCSLSAAFHLLHIKKCLQQTAGRLNRNDSENQRFVSRLQRPET